MKTETNSEMKRRLQRELDQLANERAAITALQHATPSTSKEFDALCERDKQLSIQAFTAKFKLGQLNAQQPLLGYELPTDNGIDNTGFKPVN